MADLGKTQRDSFLDVLEERLAFERKGVRLYDRALEALRASRLPAIADLLPELARIREQEKEHEDFLEKTIRSLGREPSGATPLAKLVAIESEGIEKALEGTEDASQMLHALLAAELVDEAGWELLVRLARDVGDEALVPQLERRQKEEAKHVGLVRDEVESLLRERVLGPGGHAQGRRVA